MSDSDTLIEGLRTFFKCGCQREKVRLLTIAPVSRNRNTRINFFNCTAHQARTAIELRLTDGILAFPTSLLGNQPTDPDSIERVVNYYRSDSISRPSPNRKDVVVINGMSMGKRFIQMTISKVLHLFSIEKLSLKIGKSKFYELRPKDMKRSSPHDTCLLIYHETVTFIKSKCGLI